MTLNDGEIIKTKDKKSIVSLLLLEKDLSPDKKRHLEEQKHHPHKDIYPHVPHHQHPQPHHKTLIPYHNPHEVPPEFKLNIDHGTHTDRPKPYKSMIKNGKAGKKFD